MVSCAIFITFLADTLGRRLSFVWTGYAMCIFMFYLGFFVRFDAPKTGQPTTSAGTAALVMVYLFAAAFQFGWGPVCWIYVSEIPTNRLRGYTVSIAAATQWLWNLVVTRVTPIMLKTLGGDTGYGTYFLFGCFCFTMATCAFFLPETKGVSRPYCLQSTFKQNANISPQLSLERMDELFGVADFSGIEDLGTATKHIDAGDAEASQVEYSGYAK